MRGAHARWSSDRRVLQVVYGSVREGAARPCRPVRKRRTFRPGRSMFNLFRKTDKKTEAPTPAPAPVAAGDEGDPAFVSTLWIDAPDAADQVDRRVDDPVMREKVRTFIERGYVVFDKVIDADAVAAINRDIDAYRERPAEVVMKNAGAYVDPATVEAMGRGDRMIDLYGRSPAAREAIFASPIATFLSLIFSEPAIAMQSLTFAYGSQQAIHQDTAYVVTTRPLSLAASWIALEDVTPGSGELIYYPGSHRFEPFRFSGTYKHWNQKRDGTEQHQEFLKGLHEKARANGLEIEAFLPKAGDALIWHADLAHGGSRITDPTRTRRSLVTHYTPQSVKPNYFNVVGEQYHELAHPSGHLFTSRHYDMKALAEGRAAAGVAPIYHDGGVSQARAKAPGA